MIAINFLHSKNILHSFIKIRFIKNFNMFFLKTFYKYIFILFLKSEIFIINNELKLGGFYFSEKLKSQNDLRRRDTMDMLIDSDCPDKEIGLKYDVW